MRAGRSREVRLGLVLNGGVSLAVWIGGVTREVDAARRGSAGRAKPGDTSELYGRILDALGDDLIVDVIAGASAGGINGVLLGAAIYNDTAIDNLEDTWLSLGDFLKLLRSPSVSDPPSLMKGDELVLPELQAMLARLWREGAARPKHPLYVYVTATDLFGFPADFTDSTGVRFEESDHRRVFTFEHELDPVEETAYRAEDDGVMRPIVRLADRDARELLARAARSSSSFPVAFESHRLRIRDQNGQRLQSMVDGGILDNQPFNPVLDRVAVLPAEKAVRRAIVYVVPYATDVGSMLLERDPDTIATARDTFAASGSLPRDLPKLQSLERITCEGIRQDSAEAQRRRVLGKLEPEDVVRSAEALFSGYQEARFAASQAVFELWARPDFRPGSGIIGQHSGDDPRDLLRAPEKDIEWRPVPWIPEGTPTWTEHADEWQWGLSPAERAATWALLLLRDAATADGRGTQRARDLYLTPRRVASGLIADSRAAKVAFRRAFRAASGGGDVIARAEAAYGDPAVADKLKAIQRGFKSLDPELGQATGGKGVQYLLHLEVTRNGTGISDTGPPAPFRFVFASARVDNSLGHPAAKPGEKLAGMKLNHFGGFLKRSWRANDWLWGRMDGVEHVMRVLIDDRVVGDLHGEQRKLLVETAFPPDTDADATPEERQVLATRWQETLSKTIRAGEANVPIRTYVTPSAKPAEQLAELLAARTDEEREAAALACRSALAARLQLRVLRDDLRRIAETVGDDIASGASRVAAGAYWATRFPLAQGSLPDNRLVALFRDMNVGTETLQDESSSRLGLDVGSQVAAVATAVFAGKQGGFPVAARKGLGSARSATLMISRLVRLLAREPWVGAAVIAMLAALLVWAATSKNTILGALLPALALLVFVGGLSLLTIATSVFEESVTKFSRLAGFVLFAGAPLTFVLLTRWPRFTSSIAHWFDVHMGKAATTAAAIAASVAAGAALARAFGGGITWIARKWKDKRWPRRWIRTVLLAYRGSVIVALGLLGVGFIVERTLRRGNGEGGWVTLAQEKRGTLLIIALVAVLAFSSPLAEGAAWLRSRLRAAHLRLGPGTPPPVGEEETVADALPSPGEAALR